jgi:hypothetical protein
MKVTGTLTFNLQPLGPFKFVSKPYMLALTPPEIPEAQRKLVAWWKFDETEGSKAADSSDSNNIGILVGEPKWQPTGGKIGGALQFDGVDDYVETNFAGNLPVWSVAAWVNGNAAPASRGPSGLIHRDKNFQINWDHQNENFRGAAGTQVAGTWYAASFKDLQANTWYHLVATYDGENLKAYKDGALMTSTSTAVGGSDAESETLKLGKHALYTNATNHFGGILDDVRIYNYPLSQAEITALYSGQTLPTTTQAQVPTPAQTQAPPMAEEQPGTSKKWIPPLIIVAVAVAAAALAIRKKKETA